MLCKPGHSCWVDCCGKHSFQLWYLKEVLGPNFCTESTPKFCCEHLEHHLHIQKRAGCSCSSQFRFLHLVCWWSLNMAKQNPSSQESLFSRISDPRISNLMMTTGEVSQTLCEVSVFRYLIISVRGDDGDCFAVQSTFYNWCWFFFHIIVLSSICLQSFCVRCTAYPRTWILSQLNPLLSFLSILLGPLEMHLTVSTGILNRNL